MCIRDRINMLDNMDGITTITSIGIIATLISISIPFVIHNQVEMFLMITTLGALSAFLIFNYNPAKMFMGDTGSLALGGIIAVFALAIRKELLIPVICGVFLIENLSVMIQVGYFKYTKKKLGEGKRVFLMAPLHHHFQKKGFHESKIVSRFWIVGVMLAIISIVTLKLR